MPPHFSLVLAEAPPQQPSILPMVVMMALLFGIIYLLIVRPQQRAEAQRREMQARIKKNDHVITTGGIKGIVTSVKDDEVTLKVDEANNVRIRFTRASIAAVVGEGEERAAEGGEKK
jgi:preprotein translocase subunit YajC